MSKMRGSDLDLFFYGIASGGDKNLPFLKEKMGNWSENCDPLEVLKRAFLKGGLETAEFIRKVWKIGEEEFIYLAAEHGSKKGFLRFFDQIVSRPTDPACKWGDLELMGLFRNTIG